MVMEIEQRIAKEEMVEAVAEIAHLEAIRAEATNEKAASKEATHHDSACQMVARQEAPQPANEWVLAQAGTSRNRRLRESSYDSEGSSG